MFVARLPFELPVFERKGPGWVLYSTYLDEEREDEDSPDDSEK